MSFDPQTPPQPYPPTNAPSQDAAIILQDVSKVFEIYDRPVHRLLQMLCRGRRKFYRSFEALHHIDLTIRKGECVGIVGRNGAGKSTLLQIIAGTLAPTTGSVRTCGRVAALLELGSGFNPEFTGRENVFLNAAILGLSDAEIQARYDDIVAFADIGDFIDQPVRNYSSGMVMRLAFAVIAHVDADILIVDEALSVGDAYFTQKCMRFLRQFIATKTLFFVSHDVAAINGLCTHAIFLERGRIKSAGDPKQITELSFCQNSISKIFFRLPREKSLPEQLRLPSNAGWCFARKKKISAMPGRISSISQRCVTISRYSASILMRLPLAREAPASSGSYSWTSKKDLYAGALGAKLSLCVSIAGPDGP